MDKYNNFFGSYGGRYVAEILRGPLDSLEEAYIDAISDPVFIGELESLSRDFIGRETPLLYAENLSEKIGGGDIYIKLEGLANTGAHKINTHSDRGFLQREWERKGLLRKPGLGSMELQQPQYAHGSGLNALYIWVKSILHGRGRMYTTWNSTGQKLFL